MKVVKVYFLPLILTGLVFNFVLSLILWAFSDALALGYALGSFAMLGNLFALSRGRLFAVPAFLGLVALSFWASKQPGLNLMLYALGLASPAFYGIFAKKLT